MIEIDLYRIRIGKFQQKTQVKIRKVHNEINSHGDFKSLLIKIVLLLAVLVASSEGVETKIKYSSEKMKNIYPCPHLKPPSLGGRTHFQWKQFRTESNNQTKNKQAKIIHGNIKRGIINMHVNIRSIYNKLSEVKNLIHKEKPHILGVLEADLKKKKQS